MLRKFSLILQRKLRKKMSLTQIIGKVFVPRQRALEKHLNEGEQQGILNMAVITLSRRCTAMMILSSTFL